MPKVKKQRQHMIDAIQRRWSIDYSEDSSDIVTHDDEDIIGEDDVDNERIDFSKESIMDDIKDLFSFCKQNLDTRYLSVLLYTSLRYFGHSWRNIESFLLRIGGITAKTAHRWSNILINGDFDEFISDERGGKRSESFWDCYPDIELEAKCFVIEQCSSKKSNFNVEMLAMFIDRRFYEINETVKNDSGYVRSVESCRLDLRRFGAKFTASKNRPYFLGHERPDVIQERQKFINYFVQHQKRFYSLSDDAKPDWLNPSEQPTILICR